MIIIIIIILIIILIIKTVINNLNNNTLICIATTKEYNALKKSIDNIKLSNQYSNIDILITGVGIMNATFSLMNKLNKKKYNTIINIGFAGSFNKNIHHNQWMKISKIKDIHIMEKYRNKDIIIANHTPYITLETHGKFVTDKNDMYDINNIVDMEAYALCKISHHNNIKFICYKIISDFGNFNNYEKNLNNNISILTIN